MKGITESDWRLLRAAHAVALDRFCTRVLDECAAITRSADGEAHDRYLRLYRLLQKRDAEMADAFNDMRRSRATERLAAMILLGVVTDDEIARFSPATRDAATYLASLHAPPERGGRRRKQRDGD